jgi:hypothetical protein
MFCVLVSVIAAFEAVELNLIYPYDSLLLISNVEYNPNLFNIEA